MAIVLTRNLPSSILFLINCTWLIEKLSYRRPEIFNLENCGPLWSELLLLHHFYTPFAPSRSQEINKAVIITFKCSSSPATLSVFLDSLPFPAYFCFSCKALSSLFLSVSLIFFCPFSKCSWELQTMQLKSCFLQSWSLFYWPLFPPWCFWGVSARLPGHVHIAVSVPKAGRLGRTWGKQQSVIFCPHPSKYTKISRNTTRQ